MGRVLIPVAVLIVMATMFFIYRTIVSTRRNHDRDARWEVYSEAAGDRLDGWEIGVQIHLWNGVKRELIRPRWAKEPMEIEKAEYIYKAGVLAGRYNIAELR